MFQTKKYLLLSLTIILIITACGSNADNHTAIQTAVAETVAAQNVSQPSITDTPATTLIPTQTPYQLPTSLPTLPATVAPNTGSKAECASASLQDESIVDGTIFKPNELFTKTWYITNTSNCVWDTSYKIIFWSGDVLGGGYVYNLPQATGPGQTVPISLILTTPATDGTYRSEWKLQTPDNINFGVGYLDAAFYAEIQVSSSDKPKYGVTDLSAYYVREPKTGCPANSLYTFYVTVTTSGPTEITYFWAQKDGNDSSPKTVEIESATNTTFKREWKFGRANSQGPKWVSFTITEPQKQRIEIDFEFVCP